MRRMTLDDLPLAARLQAQAGWNQTDADWRRFLAMAPEGSFVGHDAGRAVGTIIAFTFGPVAWLAMLLVDTPARGKGVGTAMMHDAVDRLDRRGVRSIRLDATPLGRPIYRRLGFVDQFELARFGGRVQSRRPGGAGHGEPVLPVAADQLSDVAALDRAVTSTARRDLIERLHHEQPGTMIAMRRGGRLAGYLCARPGAHAAQIGPCIAEPDAGAALFDDAFHRCAGREVFVDIPIDNPPAVAAAQAEGLVPKRQFFRMCRGEPVNDDVKRLWASSGPEMG